MNNNKMYLTADEAKEQKLPSAQEQIYRYNRAVEESRAARPVEDLGACFERNIARVICAK